MVHQTNVTIALDSLLSPLSTSPIFSPKHNLLVHRKSVDHRKWKFSIPMSCSMLRCYSVIQVLSDRQTWGDFSGVVKETGGTGRFGENNRKRTNHKHGHTPTLTHHKCQTSGCSSCPRRRQADIFTHQQRLFALRGEI